MSKMLYVQTSGVDTPGRLATPLFMASVARAMDMEAIVFFTIHGATTLKKGVAETLRIKSDSPKTIKDFMDDALAAGAKFMVCAQSMDQADLTAADLIPEVEVVGAATLNDLILEVDAAMFF
ncbi:MAG: DsrE family protein [Thermaerobacter sp.]|jgi:hypothetical protein|nr:DsrE family protein [Thermaerobacter sp.]MDA8146633.1 DsrE family protein [Thermaerobacter sp.]